MTKNHFHTLGLKPGASEDDIKKAYRNLAKQWHPDKNKDSGAEEKFKEISAAYEYLKCVDRREILERDLSKPKQSESSGSYSFKSDFKSSSTQNGDSESHWSKKFGQKSETRYKNSTFSSFADEGKESPFTKRKENKSNQKKKKQSKPTNNKYANGWNHTYDADDLYDDIPHSAHSDRTSRSRPNFSFAFKSFVDDLGMSFDAFFMGPQMNEPFQFSSFFGGPDPFTEFFNQGSLNSLHKDSPPRRARKHEVAPEDPKGTDGLDPEYMFSPPTTHRSDTSFSNKENYYDLARDGSDDGDMDSRLFKCTYCERRMAFSQLSTHEPGCALRRGGRFDLNEEDYDNYRQQQSPEEDQYPQNTGDWRQTHEELLNNIRKAKAKHRHSSAGSRMTSDTPRPPSDNNLSQVKCKWCGRFFSNVAAKHHIPFCEKWTKDHGTPLNPAGKQASRDKGSKHQKAKQYAKHIPKPRGNSQERSFESDPTPTASPRSHFDNFPEFGGKRETINKPTATSGTGLHASTSYSPKEKPERPHAAAAGPSAYPGPTYTSRAKATLGGLNGTARFPTTSADRASPAFRNVFDDGYSFGINGSRINTSTKPTGFGSGSCPICVKKYGGYGRLICSCGSRRKTGA